MKEHNINCSMALSHTGSALAKPLTSFLVRESKFPFINDIARPSLFFPLSSFYNAPLTAQTTRTKIRIIIIIKLKTKNSIIKLSHTNWSGSPTLHWDEWNLSLIYQARFQVQRRDFNKNGVFIIVKLRRMVQIWSCIFFYS